MCEFGLSQGDRLAALGEEGMASGVDDGFDIDVFVEDARRAVNLAWHGSPRGSCGDPRWNAGAARLPGAIWTICGRRRNG